MNGLPTDGFTSTRVVLVYVAGVEPPYSQPARDAGDQRRMTTTPGGGARPGRGRRVRWVGWIAQCDMALVLFSW